MSNAASFLRFVMRPSTAIGVALAYAAALAVNAWIAGRGVPALKVEYERFCRDADGGAAGVVETGTHYIAEDGRHRRDRTELLDAGGRLVNERTSEIRLPAGRGPAARSLERAGSGQRITIRHDVERAVIGPLEPMRWSTPPRYASPLPGGAPDRVPEMSEFTPFPSEGIAALGSRTIGPVMVSGSRRTIPAPGGGSLEVESWEVRSGNSRRTWPIVIERHVRDMAAGGGESMRVKSARRVRVAADLFDVPRGYRVQDRRTSPRPAPSTLHPSCAVTA